MLCPPLVFITQLWLVQCLSHLSIDAVEPKMTIHVIWGCPFGCIEQDYFGEIYILMITKTEIIYVLKY